MRLPEEDLTIDQQLDEFDYWLTPNQVVYHTTSKYKQEMEDTVSLIKNLNSFISEHGKESLEIKDIAQFIHEESVQLVAGNTPAKDVKAVTEYIFKVFQLLFLVTASSDNNLKAQFTAHLRRTDNRTEYCDFKFFNDREAEPVDEMFSTKSAVKAGTLAKILAKYVVAASSVSNPPPVSSAFAWSVRFSEILQSYIELIFEGSGTEQLYYLCKAYEYIASLKPEKQDIDFGEFLLRSSIVYKIRGSVTASEGHKNEHMMRDRLRFLGLQPNIDYNMNDVVIRDDASLSEAQKKQPQQKQRAFDFVLPYNINDWDKDKTKIYMQAQFYAGDSGSVSHKVIDQMKTSREALKVIKGDNRRFVEYLDGAGYASALRGDLKKILELEDTDSFVQIKSILVRLRREMQIIDYANPTDIAQAIYLAKENNTETEVKRIMQEDFGFSEKEANRALRSAIQHEQITVEDGNLAIAKSELEEAARWTFILDHVVLEGETLTKEQREDQNHYIVPGYGRAYGALGSTIQDKITEISDELSTQFVRDVESLVELGVLKHGGKYV